MAEFFGNCLILLGSIFSLISVLGTIRFENIYEKMHAATKTSTLGCGLILAGTAFHMDNSRNLTEIIFLIFFISLTIPISAHLLAKFIYAQQARVKQNRQV